jgi:2-polyprenyl-6-hydroxyphenyl methylase/3-demethylubiquinone-9 3-methyltransferase
VGILNALVSSQVRICRAFDGLLPEKYRVDGNQDFITSFAPKYLRPGLCVYDVGGGKQPYVSVERKMALGLVVVGLDIDQHELERAPAGAYDRVIAADITRFRGSGEADLLICQALLEHVRDVRQAFAAIASILKPGGTAAIFVPSRNAVYARINRLLPEWLKRKILFALFPDTNRAQGFPSYYDRCTPKDFRRLAAEHGLGVVEETHYYISGYFTFFFPLHFVWRIWVLFYHALAREQAAETFCMALRRVA